MKDLEQVYDDEISPLMSQIIAICKKHEMPMFATFQYKDNEDEQDASRYLIGEDAAQHVLIRLGFDFEEGISNESVAKFIAQTK